MKRIAVIGSGIVGQATGFGLIEKAHDVVFYDINPDVVELLQARNLNARLAGDLGETGFDIVMVCVSTPSADDGSVNLSHIIHAMDNVEQLLLRNGKRAIVVIRSTVPPTTTELVLAPLLERHGLRRGEDFGLAMNPEFLRAKSHVEDFAHPWVTVIGVLDMASGDVLEGLYMPFGGQIFRVRIAEAEMIKYAHNLRNAMIVSFSNEMWHLNRMLGDPADITTVMDIVVQSAESAWNPSYGSFPGQPYGGTCLPKDTKGLLAFAQSQGIALPLLSAIVSVNTMMEQLAKHGIVPEAQIAGQRWQAAPSVRRLEVEK